MSCMHGNRYANWRDRHILLVTTNSLDLLSYRPMPSSLILALCFGLAQQPADTALPITNVNVLPMNDDRVLRGQTVVIERGIITHIGSASYRPTALPSYRLIDGTGKYLIPGLVDVHVHFHGNPS